MTQEAARHRFGYAARRSYFLVRRASVDGHRVGELVGVDSTEGEKISPLDTISTVEML